MSAGAAWMFFGVVFAVLWAFWTLLMFTLNLLDRARRNSVLYSDWAAAEDAVKQSRETELSG